MSWAIRRSVQSELYPHQNNCKFTAIGMCALRVWARGVGVLTMMLFVICALAPTNGQPTLSRQHKIWRGSPARARVTQCCVESVTR
jgi:hypothetical protein